MTLYYIMLYNTLLYYIMQYYIIQSYSILNNIISHDIIFYYIMSHNIDDNFQEAAIIFEASGDYERAIEYYTKSQNYQKEAELGFKLARMKMIDEEYLLSYSIDNIDINILKMLKGAVENVKSSSLLSSSIKENIKFEFFLLVNHLLLDINNIEVLKARALNATQSHRLMMIATRCIIRNFKKTQLTDEVSKTSDIVANKKKVNINDKIHKCSNSYRLLCMTFLELFSSLKILILQLQNQTRTYNTTVRTSPESENLTRQCEEIFEFTRSLNKPFGGCSLIVEDLPAANKIWIIERKETKSTINLKSVNKDKNKNKNQLNTKSDARNILNSYDELSTNKNTSLSSPDFITVEKKIRREINMKTFVEKAETFLIQKIFSTSYDYFYEIFQFQLRQFMSEKGKDYQNYKERLINGKCPEEPSGVLESSTSRRLKFLEESCKVGFLSEEIETKLITEASAYLLLELRPSLPLLEDIQAVVEIRKHQILQKCLLKTFPIKMTFIRYSFEEVVQRLLCTASIILVDKYKSNEELIQLIKDSTHWNGKDYGAIQLCCAFQYEIVSSEQVTIPNNMIKNFIEKNNAVKEHQNMRQDYFLQSIYMGSNFVTLEWTDGNPLFISNACLSPDTYIIILEKYVVMLLLYSNQCENVLISTSLLFDVFCSQNAAYVSMIRCCSMKLLFSDEKVGYMKVQMTRLAGPLFYLLNAGYDSIEVWVRQALKNKNDVNRSEEDISQLMSILLVRIYSILIIISFNENSRYRREKCIMSLIKTVTKENHKILNSVPITMKKFLSTLRVRTSTQEFIDFFKSMRDPILSTTIQENSMSNQKYKLQQAHLSVEIKEGSVNITIRPYVPCRNIDLNTIGQSKQILKRPEKKVDENNKNQIPIEVENIKLGESTSNDNAPEFEFSKKSTELSPSPPPPQTTSTKIELTYTEKCYTIFKCMVQESKDRIKKFKATDILQRELEMSFRRKFDKFERKHVFVTKYIKEIMPFVTEIKYYQNIIKVLGTSFKSIDVKVSLF